MCSHFLNSCLIHTFTTPYFFFSFVHPLLRGCSNRLRSPNTHRPRSEPVARRAFIPLPESQSIRRTPSHLRSIDAQDHTNANLRRLLFREELFGTYIHTRMHTPPCMHSLLLGIFVRNQRLQ